MEPAESRIVEPLPLFPAFSYIQTFGYYMAANLGFYHYVFRRTNDRRQFAAFLLVNIFVSNQLSNVTNAQVTRHYAAYYNNMLEKDHRNVMT